MATSPGTVVSSSVSSVFFSTKPTPTCPMFDGDQYKCDVIVGIRKTVASLSLIGCLFMIAVIWLFRKYRSFVQRLILYLSIAALLDDVSYLMGDLHPDGTLCNFQAFLLTFFEWSVLLWVCCITFNLTLNIIWMTRTDKYEIVYHVLSWGVPLILSCLPFIGNHYGPAGAWCWIPNQYTHWRFGIWYGPLFCLLGLMVVVYTCITVTLNRKVKRWEGTYDPDVERNKDLLKEDIKPLRAYPFIYLALSIFPLVHRIQNAISPDNTVFALVVLHALTSPLQGMVNAIVYGLDRETIVRLTPTSIKLAIQSHFNQPTLISEYPSAPVNSQDASADLSPVVDPEGDLQDQEES
ncbi:cyclic AMP receptor-like protein A [Branchiostoma lanceolatum]